MVKKAKTPVDDRDTRERLISVAREVFAEKGFAGATVKEISDRAGVNISLISYHFHGKEGLFRTVLEEFGRERLADAEKILTPPDSLEDMRAKLKLWSRQFLQCHVDQNNVCSILHKEDIFQFDFMREIFLGTFMKSFEAITQFFHHAKKKGIVKKEFDATMIAALLFGGYLNVGRSQKIMQEVLGKSLADDKYRSQIVDEFVGILLGGIHEKQ